MFSAQGEQLSLFAAPLAKQLAGAGAAPELAAAAAREEAVKCIASRM